MRKVRKRVSNMLTDEEMIKRLLELRDSLKTLADKNKEISHELGRVVIKLDIPDVDYVLYTDTPYQCPEPLTRLFEGRTITLDELCRKGMWVIKALQLDGHNGDLWITMRIRGRTYRIPIYLDKLTVEKFLLLWDIEEKTGLITELIKAINREVEYAKTQAETLRQNLNYLRTIIERELGIKVSDEE